MTTRQRNSFDARIRNGDQYARRHYERVVNDILDVTLPSDDLDDIHYPTDIGDTKLAYAVFRAAVDDRFGHGRRKT
jgi:hypothetical protein